MTREETIHELGEWLEQMIQHGVPSHSAKRKALATAIARLSAEVVQCKDCRFAEKGTDLSVEETDEGTPRHYIDWVKCHNYDIHKGSMRYVGYDDYCSWGERKGGDDE